MSKIQDKIKPTKKTSPQCYAFTTPTEHSHDGYVKIGYTEQEDVRTRIDQETKTAAIPYTLEWARRAQFISPPYGTFRDNDFFAYLQKVGVVRMSPPPGQKKAPEWFLVDPDVALNYYKDFIDNHGVLPENMEVIILYCLRDEQSECVEQTEEYFKNHKNGEFLWNCKPRFGKTLTTYHLCSQMDFKNILIVTNRPAIADSWYNDYEKFFGPESGWIFVSTCDAVKDCKYVMDYDQYKQKVMEDGDNIKGMIRFVSLQDLKGSRYFGGKYDKLVECSDYIDPVSGEYAGFEWDMLVIDEAHEGVDTYKTDVAFDHIRRKNTLHLSGTPFKALASDKFNSNAIYNWTYADEQKKKADWDPTSEEENPYGPLPNLNLFTYQMTDFTKQIIQEGINNGDENFALNFTLAEFFSTWTAADAPKEEWIGRFKYEEYVDKFLDALVTGEKFPFSTPELREKLKHTFWYLDRVDSALALKEKLNKHPVFSEYYVIPAVGNEHHDDGLDADDSLGMVKEAIKKYDKTITLSVGQLTTGVTIPEWTAVLMLCNKKSESLYMQAAFRAQNPCLFTDEDGNTYRKENAYVFDFDPSRVLKLFDKFANNLNADTSAGRGSLEDRKRNIRELLNFFPVYAEDDLGEMVELDAEQVLTIPQHQDAKKVVNECFMANELFDNISNIFGAPQQIIDIIDKMNAPEHPAPDPTGITESTKNDLYLNDRGEVDIPEDVTIGKQAGIFGEKVYGEVIGSLETAGKKAEKNSAKDSEDTLVSTFGEAYTKRIVDAGKEGYGQRIDPKVEEKVRSVAKNIIHSKHQDYSYKKNLLEKERDDLIEQASTGSEQTQITREYEDKIEKLYKDTASDIARTLGSKDVVDKGEQVLIKEKEKAERESIKAKQENDTKEHLKGFSRTIPSFLMAFGNENTTLANFEQGIPDDVFLDVTSITIEEFKQLRDGYDYVDENGVQQHYDGHLFNEVVFNEAVQIFLQKKKELANYFDPAQKEDIFSYIPPQKTNQIFTPKKVVVQMADMLMAENPGCFDNPDATFADLYMKSGMYVTEIVKRLYNSPVLKAKFPDSGDRLRHIFAKQVYGCAPTGILYGITRAYILGFADEIEIPVDHIIQMDTLESAQAGTLEDDLLERFPERGGD